MIAEQRGKIIKVSSKKIQEKENNVGLSFYVNKNDIKELLMEVGTYWIRTLQKINTLVLV